MGNPEGRPHEKENPPQPSPRAPPTSNTNTNGGGGAAGGSSTAAATRAPPSTPKTIPRSDASPYPTTFVQADTASFKQIVQMLTGSADTAAKSHHSAAPRSPPSPPSPPRPTPPAKTGPKRPAFKLCDRRHGSFKNLRINPLPPGLLAAPAAVFSPRHQPEVLSPSVLDFPSLALSPVTPLIPDPFARTPHPRSPAGLLAEQRGIAEKGFYLHPSPRGADPPKLLPLFPVTSPRSSSSAAPASP